LLGEEPDKRREVQLRPFPVVARPLTVEALFEFLAIAGRGHIPGSGVLYANTVPWIRQLLSVGMRNNKLALEGVDRQIKQSVVIAWEDVIY